jgi:DNA-binding MarR family transcriptional regulator
MASRVTHRNQLSTRARAEAPQLSPAAVRATAAFRASLRRFERTSEQIALEGGLTPRRYLLLLMVKGSLDGSERATVSELTERLQLAQHTVTELVGRAEEAGLICRERSTSDGRVSYVRLTAEGERRLARAFSDLDTERRTLMAALKQSPSANNGRS